MTPDSINSRTAMSAEPETSCPDCGKAYQPDLATGLAGGCPHCLARSLAGEDPPVDEGPAPFHLTAGETFGSVEILEPLARGGMGVVYKARQTKLNRIVALKVIDSKLAGSPEFTSRFEREARALATLNHPNVVQVFDYGQEGGLCYLVMEWVDGTTLREILSAGHLSPEDALRYLPQICDALEYAHAQGVVHRDIKPENILIDRQGQLKIADFGIARMRDDLETGTEFVTRAGQQMGTPQYMAPEQQTHSDRVDHRADLYSLGVVFYEMLTGELPLGRFPSPSQRVQVDVSLDEVVLKTLERDPNRRYQRASEIKQAVTQPAAASSPPPAAPAPKPAPAYSRVTAFAWWTLAFAVLSLPALWEMARPWVLESTAALVNEHSFFNSKIYESFLRAVSLAAALLAWIFGGISLVRIKGSRKTQMQVTGKALTLSAMFTPVVLLVLLVLFQILPLGAGRVIGGPDFPLVIYIGVIVLVSGAILLPGLRALIRRLKAYAFDPDSKFPAITHLLALLVISLLGATTWAISREWREARSYGFELQQSLVVVQMSPTDPEALHTPNDEDVNLWLEFVQQHWVLKRNLFGNRELEELSSRKRLAHTQIDGETVTAWMPPSGNFISFTHDLHFRDQHGYLWVHEFDIVDGALEVIYEFPLRRFRGRLTNHRPDSAETLEKEKRLREKYGVEPDTLYQVEIPVKDLEQYMTFGMDNEFWQSATRLNQN